MAPRLEAEFGGGPAALRAWMSPSCLWETRPRQRLSRPPAEPPTLTPRTLASDRRSPPHPSVQLTHQSVDPTQPAPTAPDEAASPHCRRITAHQPPGKPEPGELTAAPCGMSMDLVCGQAGGELQRRVIAASHASTCCASWIGVATWAASILSTCPPTR